jgi:hypothetical protein
MKKMMEKLFDKEKNEYNSLKSHASCLDVRRSYTHRKDILQTQVSPIIINQCDLLG